MFVLAPPNAVELGMMLGVLKNFDVKTTRTSYNGKELIVVDGENRKGDETLCEWAFQMNFHQKSTFLCDMCKLKIEEKGEGDDHCGHITFTKRIRGAF